MAEKPDEKARINAQRAKLARLMVMGTTKEESEVPVSLSPEVLSTALDGCGAAIVRWAVLEGDTEAVKLAMDFALERGCGPDMRAAIVAAYDKAGSRAETPKKSRGRPPGPRTKEPTRDGWVEGDTIARAIFLHMTTGNKAGYTAGLDWAEAHYGLPRKRLRKLVERLERRRAGMPLT